MARAVTLVASSFPSAAEGVILAADIPGKESRIYRQPAGVVGMIGPWNFPLHLSSRSVVNDSPVNDLPNCLFGGEKNSGLGRYNRRWSIDEFTTAHWISVQHDPRRIPF